MKTLIRNLLLLLALSAATASAEDTGSQPLDTQMQDIKQQVLALNRDLFLLEEELLFPANTQVSVFLSLDVGTFFDLDAVELKLDGKTVTHHLYTRNETEALRRGGVQRLYLGNLKSGGHELVALYTGKGPHERDYRRGTTLKVSKGLGPKYVELQISDSTDKQQPAFIVKEWE